MSRCSHRSRLPKSGNRASVLPFEAETPSFLALWFASLLCLSSTTCALFFEEGADRVSRNLDKARRLKQPLPYWEMAGPSTGPGPLDIESRGEFEAEGTLYETDGKRVNGVRSIWQHKVSADIVLNRLSTDAARGLTLADAEKRLAKYGPNRLSPPLQKPWWRKVIPHFTDMFSLMLLFASFLCVLAFLSESDEPMHLYLGVFLFVVVVTTSLFSYAQQFKSDKTLREFQHLLPAKAVVRRDGGSTFEIDAAQLVVGDIVKIKIGDKLPADIRVLYSNRFTVDNSSLTGESEPLELVPEMTSTDPLETSNLAFFGCLALDGSCTGVVIATGDRTVFGEIAALTSATDGKQRKTTLQRDIHHFVVLVSAFAFAVGALFFTTGLITGTRFIHNFVYSIGIIVSNIPEGLLATVTVSLTASAYRMSRKNVLVKRLDAVESLGSTTVICSDKTGTLTQNTMYVSHVAHGGRIETIDANWTYTRPADRQDGEVRTVAQESISALIYCASVCSTAVFEEADIMRYPEKDIMDRVVVGNPSEAGILRFTERIHSTQDFRRRNDLLATIPFNSKRKYMITCHRCQDSEHLLRVVMKGAPEKILSSCSEFISKEGVRSLSERDFALLDKQVTYLAGRGERVLGYAEKRLSPQLSARIMNGDGSNPSIDEIPTTGLCLVGFVSLLDPPRANVPEAVQKCKEAGIRVIMVTGDHPETARSIAQQVGIITKSVDGEDEAICEGTIDSAAIISGVELRDADQERWKEILSRQEIVFARTSPQQKLQIVEQLQLLNEVVTVTGDGCNDAPALRQANTGIAMGISGSDVSREAANIILLDDNFCSIVDGVEEGRLIFDNLKKSIAYTLTSNVPQLVPFLVFIILQIPLPLTTVLILCIDLGTDIFPAIALAYERPESDTMKRPPRNAKSDYLMNARLVSYSTLQIGVMQSFAGFLAYFIIMNDYGLGPRGLLNLSAGAHFGSERIGNQRWLYATQEKPSGAAFNANWFTRDDLNFVKYFAAKQPGFLRQAEDRFELLPASSTSKNQESSDGKRADPKMFQNMVKVIGFETNRPPCHAFSCKLDGKKGNSENDIACFDPKLNTGLISLHGLKAGKKNVNVNEGTGPTKGCFSLWTPRREREVLRRAQTGFFAAIVIAQVFTVFACRTRILSVFQNGLKNSVLMFSILVELAVSIVLVYLPMLRRGFDVRPLKLVHWLPGIPFGIFILAYDECRKWLIRRHIENESGLVVPRSGRVDRIAKWVNDYTLW